MTNSDIYKYVNSKDIRQHLININYVFSTDEAAWLVYQCRHITLNERLSAWKNIIDTMPDVSISCSEKPYNSIHIALKEYISMKEDMLKMFLCESPGVFFQCTIDHNDISDNYDDSTAWSSLDKCLRQLKLDLKNDHSDDFRYGYIRRSEIDSGCPITARFNRTGEMLDVILPADYGIFDWRITDLFDRMWFHFPVPYKPGDILYDPSNPGQCSYSGPIVMDGITPLQYDMDKRSHTDSTDMNVWGYFQNEESGTIYYDTTWNYMDYEFFPVTDLKGKTRILKALSNYVKNQISLDLFIRAYHLIILEEAGNNTYPRGQYTDEGLKLAGLIR